MYIPMCSDITWSTGEGNGKPLQYSCHENPMNSMKRQKDMTSEYETPKSYDTHYVTDEEQKAVTNSSRKNEAGGPKQKLPSVMDVSSGEKCKEIEENDRMGKTRDLFQKIRDTKRIFHASSVQFSHSVVSDSL